MTTSQPSDTTTSRLSRAHRAALHVRADVLAVEVESAIAKTEKTLAEKTTDNPWNVSPTNAALQSMKELFKRHGK